MRKQGDTAELVLSEREPVTLAWQVSPASEIGRKGALHLAFEKLFASPFGPPAVTAFESRPPDLELREIEPPAATATTIATATPPDTRVATARKVAGWTATAAGATGIVFSALAVDRYAAGEGASQVQLDELNRQVRQFNVVSVACFAVAIAAGATWFWLRE